MQGTPSHFILNSSWVIEDAYLVHFFCWKKIFYLINMMIINKIHKFFWFIWRGLKPTLDHWGWRQVHCPRHVLFSPASLDILNLSFLRNVSRDVGVSFGWFLSPFIRFAGNNAFIIQRSWWSFENSDSLGKNDLKIFSGHVLATFSFHDCLWIQFAYTKWISCKKPLDHALDTRITTSWFLLLWWLLE
jgi:hypothetical protein